jgi:hypothetical protein
MDRTRGESGMLHPSFPVLWLVLGGAAIAVPKWGHMSRSCPRCRAPTAPLAMETATGRTTQVLALAAVDGDALDLATVLALRAYVCRACGHVELVSARWEETRG